MQDKSKNQTEIVSEKRDEPSFSESRRKLTKAGLAAPVLLSIANRPAWAGGCAPSAFFSNAHTSAHPDEPECVPQGCSPGYWKTNTHKDANKWPSGFVPDTRLDKGGNCSHDTYQGQGNYCYEPTGTKFIDYFSKSPLDSSMSLQQVMWTRPGTVYNHAVAALLNAASGKISLSIAQVQDIFNDLFSTGEWQSGIGPLSWNSGEFNLEAYFTNYASWCNEPD